MQEWSFEAVSFEMTMGWIPSQNKGVFRPTRFDTHGVAVGYCIAPRRSGAPNQRIPPCGVEWFCRGEQPLALLPRDWLQGYRLCNCDPRPHVIPTIPHQCHFGHPPLSFRAQREILARKPRFLRRSLSHLFEAGSFEMTAMRQLFLRIGPGASIRNGRRPQD